MNTEALSKYISKYISLTPEEESFLFSRLTGRNYLKGQYIVQQGDICRHLCFITSGCTKAFYIDAEGNEHIMMFSVEDWWASDMGSFISQTPSDYHILCLENTKLIQFPVDNIEELYAEIPKLERFFRKLFERALIASHKRIVRIFSQTAKERYLNFRETYPKIEQRVPQYMIASYLGITKEFLSKIKSQLIQES